jgi:metal-sulfur cluster biosynthetic enzyme
MPLTEEQVRDALKQVVDPELFVNIIDLGLVYTVTVAPAQPRDGAAGSSTERAAVGAVAAHPADAPALSAAPSADAAVAADSGGPQEDVFIEMTMTSPACPAGPQLITGAKQAVGRLPGVSNVEVKIVMTPPWTPDLMTEAARDQLGIF